MTGSAKNAPATVLVADGELDLLTLLVVRLGKAGYQVIDASNGEEAPRRAQEAKSDVVVLAM